MKNIFENKSNLYKFLKIFIYAIIVIIWLYSFLHWLLWNCLLIPLVINFCSSKPTIAQLFIVITIIFIYLLITIFYLYFWKFFTDHIHKATAKKKNFILAVGSIIAFYLCFILTLFLFLLMSFSGH